MQKTEFPTHSKGNLDVPSFQSSAEAWPCSRHAAVLCKCALKTNINDPSLEEGEKRGSGGLLGNNTRGRQYVVSKFHKVNYV